MSAPSPGDRVAGRYRLDAPIGRGANASVFRAHDEILARGVAIKFLFVRDPRHTQWLTDHFLREARLAAAVDHPNVVHTIDFGSHDGRPYMVMELLGGEPLAVRLERAPPLDLDQIVELHCQILSGLGAVHDAGIVHRDVKPDNVILLPDGGGYRAKIVDFGVSRAVRPGTQVRSALTTREGLVVGTPEYMSPEQARGLPDIDLRSDLYAVGVMLYEALAGDVPYSADSMGDLLIAIAKGGAPEVRELRPTISQSLSTVVMRAMALDPGERFASAREMAQALSAAGPAHHGGIAGGTGHGTVGEYGAAPSAKPTSSLPSEPPTVGGVPPLGRITGRTDRDGAHLLDAPGPAVAAAAAGAAASAAADAGDAGGPHESPLGSADTLEMAGPSRSLPQVDQSTPPVAGLLTQMTEAREADNAPLELAVAPRVHRPGLVTGPDRVGVAMPGRRVARGPGPLVWGLLALLGAGALVAWTEPGRRLAIDAMIELKRRAPALAGELMPGSTTIRISLVGAPEGALIRLDGSEIPTSELELPRDGALHLLEVEARGFERWSVSFEAREDATHHVELVPSAGARRRR